MKILTKVKEIVSKTGEMHFERWAIIETKFFSWYLHRIHKADQDHLHSHPWHFVSVILKGCYLEEVQDKDFGVRINTKKPFVIAYTNRKWFHKIKEIVRGPVYTTMFVWGGNFEGDKWHYSVGNKVIPFVEYRKIKSAAKQAGKTIEEFLATRP